MKVNYRFFFRMYVALLVLTLSWCIWAPAQTATNNVSGTNAAAVTVESDDTVKSVTTFFELKPATLSFGLDKVEALQGKVAGIPAWQYLASAIFILLAFVIAKLIDVAVAGFLKTWASKTKTFIDDIVIDLLKGPIRWLAFIILLQIGLQVFDWPGWLESYLRKGFYVLIACSITYMVLKFVDILLNYFKNRNAAKADRQFNELLFPIISKIAKGILLIVALLMTLDNLGLNVRSLIAGVSIGGLALGLAAQDTVGNLFGAVSVFVDKPFTVGDRIELSGVNGVVEEIGLRSTRIRNLDGHLITVPNKTMGSSIITNFNRRPNIKTVFDVGVTYDLSAEQVKRAAQIIEEILKPHPMTHDFLIGFNRFGDSALNINVTHWWKDLDWKKYVAGMQEVYLEIKRRFDAEKIGFAFPSQTVYLRQDNDWKIETQEKTVTKT